MGNQGSAPHEPFDRAHMQHADLKMKSSVRSSFRRARAGAALSPPRAGMERLRKSFRESFRRRKGGEPPESARPHQWHADESAVRAGTCTFPVKYLGCVEVLESRGMGTCEEALKALRNSRRRAIRAVLHIGGDGLRVVEEETKGLLVDQTIEKVSFCAPDRNHERGFSYICRDGTTRRWMCHGFLAARDSGERLSHAVGCAFAACLERKQQRDKECAVSMSIDAASHAFTRQGSFRKSVMTSHQIVRRASEAAPAPAAAAPAPAPPPPAPRNPFAVERPHAAPHMLERQGSFRGFSHLANSGSDAPIAVARPRAAAHLLERQGSIALTNNRTQGQNQRRSKQIESSIDVHIPLPLLASLNGTAVRSDDDQSYDIILDSPFKRQMSLRISELPSNLERVTAGLVSPPRALPAPAPSPAPAPAPPPPPARQESRENGLEADPVAAMCQQLSSGLRALAAEPVPLAPLPAATPHPLPHPDQWLGRVAGTRGAGPGGPAPGLGAAGRAASFAGHSATNPFLTPTATPL